MTLLNPNPRIDQVATPVKYSLGFTGTSDPGAITPAHRLLLEKLIRDSVFIEFHHGDCIGADALAHEFVRVFRPDVKIHIHPPAIEHKRAFCTGDVMHPPRPYHDRNQDIVDASHGLIAISCTSSEYNRSGTWSTVRKARQRGISIWILYPDGTIQYIPQEQGAEQI